jgi:hypothetical protein
VRETNAHRESGETKRAKDRRIRCVPQPSNPGEYGDEDSGHPNPRGRRHGEQREQREQQDDSNGELPVPPLQLIDERFLPRCCRYVDSRRRHTGMLLRTDPDDRTSEP